VTSNRKPQFEIALVNEQSLHAVAQEQLCDAVRAVLLDSEFASAMISVAVVDDVTMHELNRRYLEHDWPTDVLSFVLECEANHLEGEIIISADTAAIAAVEAGWSAAAEQLLYVVHGTLHLVGYRDKTGDEAVAMRAAEAEYLAQFGFKSRGVTGVDANSEVVPAGSRRRGGARAR
jgi:probable rRNA maturation factor